MALEAESHFFSQWSHESPQGFWWTLFSICLSLGHLPCPGVRLCGACDLPGEGNIGPQINHMKPERTSFWPGTTINPLYTPIAPSLGSLLHLQALQGCEVLSLACILLHDGYLCLWIFSNNHKILEGSTYPGQSCGLTLAEGLCHLNIVPIVREVRNSQASNSGIKHKGDRRKRLYSRNSSLRF
jgi:hypothetical protein